MKKNKPASVILDLIMSFIASFIVFKYYNNSVESITSFVLFYILFSSNFFKDSIKSTKETSAELLIKYIKNNDAKFYTLFIIPIIYFEIFINIFLLFPLSQESIVILVIVLVIEVGTWMMIVSSVIEGKSSNETIGRFFAGIPTDLIKLLIALLYSIFADACLPAKALFLTYLSLGGIFGGIYGTDLFGKANQFYIYISSILIGLICGGTIMIIRSILLRFKPNFLK